MPIFDQTEFLFKKSLGIVDSRTSVPYAAESAGVARPNVIGSLQVMNQLIPTTAPTDLDTAVVTTGIGGYNVTKQVSKAYSYLAKYTITLSQFISPNQSFRYGDPATNSNLLSNAIPANYDPTGGYGTSALGYGITLTGTTNNPPASIPANDSNYPWLLDTDAGYLYFTSNAFPYGFPVITFWRYEGTFGVANTIGQQFTN